jgi:hypothetical protein
MKRFKKSICSIIFLFLLCSVALIHPLAYSHEIEELNERIEKLEEIAVTSTKDGIKMGGTTLNLSGYIKTDLLYTDNGVNGGNGVITVRSVKDADPDGERRFDLTARESRLRIKTSTPIDGKPFKTHIEVDFYGSGGNEVVSNSYGLRLRHAYGSWGNLFNWSNLVYVYGS